MQGAASTTGETAHGVMDKARELRHKISDSTSSMSERARDMTHGARDRMHESAGSARARVNELGHRSQEQYYRAKDSVSHMIDEQPLLIGALGIAIGTILGAVLPSTRREDELMGSKRDELLDRAKATAREQAEKVKESAKRIAQTAKQETERVASTTSNTINQGNGHANRPGASASEDLSKPNGAPGPHGYH